MNGLEQSLDDVENEKDIVTTEKNKWLWEYQKRQKVKKMYLKKNLLLLKKYLSDSR